jgi:hypothetical protein
MELEQLKAIREEIEGTPDAGRFDAAALSRSKGRVGRLGVFVHLDLVQDAVAVAALGWFALVHLAEPRFLLPALFLLAGFAFHLVSGLRQRAALGRIDWGGPVAGIQDRLAGLRVERVRAARPWASRLGRLLAGRTLADAERELAASSRLVSGEDAG